MDKLEFDLQKEVQSLVSTILDPASTAEAIAEAREILFPAEEKTILESKNDEENKTEEPKEPAEQTFTQAEVDELIKSRVAEEMGKIFKGKTPTASRTEHSSMTQEQFNGLSYNERLKLFQTNPKAYHRLANK